MKQLLFLLLILTNSMLMAQSPTIDQKWREIDKEIQNGQFKSIQPKIDEIKALSRKDNNHQSLVKALFYDAKVKVATSDETDDVNFVFENFKKELNGKSAINDAIVNSYLAQLYQVYYYPFWKCSRFKWLCYSFISTSNRKRRSCNSYSSRYYSLFYDHSRSMSTGT